MLRSSQKPYTQELSGLTTVHERVRISMLRLDVIDPVISGNKWYKLIGNLERVRSEGYDQVLTFGGAYSNHIAAAAAACGRVGLRSIGVIRGELPTELNPTLRQARTSGMELFSVSRSEYTRLKTANAASELEQRFGPSYVLPEGGTNCLGISGAAEIASMISDPVDFVTVSIGTGGTMAGLLTGLSERTTVLGFPALRGLDFGKIVIELLEDCGMEASAPYAVLDAYHFGGYARFDSRLVDFINEFRNNHGVSLDPVYTGKMMFGVCDLLQQGYFPPSSHVLALHTGGLQGIAGFNERHGALIEG